MAHLSIRLSSRERFARFVDTILAFSPDSKHFAVVSAPAPEKKPHLLLVAIDSGKIVRDFGDHDADQPGMLLFSPDGKLLVSLAKDKLRRWDPANGKELTPLGTEGSTQVQFAPDGKTLALTDGRSVRLYKPWSGHELLRIDLETKNTWSWWDRDHLHGMDHTLAFSPDSKTLAVADRRAIRLWDLATGKEVGPAPNLGTIHSVAVADKAHMVAACTSRQIQVWDARSGKIALRIPAWLDTAKREVALTSVAISPDGHWLAAGGSDGGVTLFNALATDRPKHLRFHARPITSLVFSSDGKTLVSADMDFKVAVWDRATGVHAHKVGLPRRAGKGTFKWMKEGPDAWHELLDGAYFFIARQPGPVLSPDGRLLIAASAKTLGLYELASSRARGLNYPRPHQGKFAVSANGQLLVAGPNWDESYYIDRDSALHLIDVATGAEMRVVANFPRIRDFSISPDGKLLAACGPKGLCLWDTATGTLQADFNGHRGVVTTVAFSTDGSMLVSAAHDGTMLVWSVAALMATQEKQELSAGDLKRLWDTLTSPGAGNTREAMALLTDQPQRAAALFRDKLKATAVSEKEIARLLTDLGNKHFKIRENARKELAQLAELAEPALRALLKANPSLEQRARVEKLLARFREPIRDGDKLRALRAVELLELAGSLEAIDVLQTLADGAENAYVTREAQAALRRLNKKYR
jgi:WD40 repeat protein